MQHTRESLDRHLIDSGKERLTFTCENHPGIPMAAVYANGSVRLLCAACGFEAADIKVAWIGERGKR